ncbi:hypothetical protein C5167_025244 [Papaver somniferum]|uniref:Uncharacterized protein n=1 Tax=Papaver somniferum TaxID=3469 RepID=A0A4Y7JTW1_PAPSO|nr:hypothetical protein C5167_025244 [Papaver somniferum]
MVLIKKEKKWLMVVVDEETVKIQVKEKTKRQREGGKSECFISVTAKASDQTVRDLSLMSRPMRNENHGLCPPDFGSFQDLQCSRVYNYAASVDRRFMNDDFRLMGIGLPKL